MKMSLSLIIALGLLGCAHTPSQNGHRQTASDFLLDEDSDTQVQEKTLIGLYNNPEKAPTFNFIRAAKSTIDVEIYEMYDQTFLKLLIAQANHSVRVRIVKDSDPVGGDKCHLFEPKVAENPPECALQKLLKDTLAEKGGSLVQFNKKNLCASFAGPGSCFEHGKMIIVDGKKALISSGNFNGDNLCDQLVNPGKCNRDFSYITRDVEAVAALKEIFERDLVGNSYDLQAIITSGRISQKINVSPLSTESLVSFVQSAEKSLQIENQYMEDPQWNQAIMTAAKERHVKVTIQVANLKEFGKINEKEQEKFCTLFEGFEKAGIQVRLFMPQMKQGGRPGYLHAKAMVADGQRGWIGSVNGSSTSLTKNREYGIFFNNPERVQYLSKILSDDFTNPESLSWKDQLNCLNP